MSILWNQRVDLSMCRIGLVVAWNLAGVIRKLLKFRFGLWFGMQMPVKIVNFGLFGSKLQTILESHDLVMVTYAKVQAARAA